MVNTSSKLVFALLFGKSAIQRSAVRTSLVLSRSFIAPSSWPLAVLTTSPSSLGKKQDNGSVISNNNNCQGQLLSGSLPSFPSKQSRTVMSASSSSGDKSCSNGEALPNHIPDAEYTTNEEDQAEAAGLRERLRNAEGDQPTTTTAAASETLDTVQIADGTHKYVLIRAVSNDGSGKTLHFVTSRRGAAYHNDAAEPFVYELERCGYTRIAILGGGRILLDEDDKFISIFGFSYGFGMADHAISRTVVQQHPKYKDYDIQISNEGY